MAFERFEKRARPVTKEATITLQRSGAISFNRVAWERMGEPESVELLFDPESQRVGVQAADEAAPHAYALHGGAKRERNTFLISGKAFTQYYDIDVSRSIRRTATIEDGMLIIDLADPGVEVTSNRRKATGSSDAASDQSAEGGPEEDRDLTQPTLEEVHVSRGTG